MRTRLKVCCIQSPDEAALAIGLGADAIGLVAQMPSGPGPITDARIAEIAARVPGGVETFLLTCATEPGAVVDHVLRAGVTTVQLVDEVEPGVYDALRSHASAVRIVQVVHVEDKRAVDDAATLGAHVDAILLDSGRPRAAIRELGGTGRTHDWSLSRRIVEAAPCPVYLAGGIRPDNVADAIAAVRPFAIDLCSGVRTNGRLDESKLRALVGAMRSADGVAMES